MISTNRKKAAVESQDILSLLVEDHQALKGLLNVMKDLGRPLPERLQALRDFAPLLEAHTKPEERSLYKFMRSKDLFREASFEGEVEHGLVGQLLEEAKHSSQSDPLGARLKVLAERIELHLRQEEEELFPRLAKEVDREILVQLSDSYLVAQEEILAERENSTREWPASPFGQSLGGAR